MIYSNVYSPVGKKPFFIHVSRTREKCVHGSQSCGSQFTGYGKQQMPWQLGRGEEGDGGEGEGIELNAQYSFMMGS